jgi:REP element-mobilizing transposase RayT
MFSHIVWSTKKRMPLISNEVKKIIYPLIHSQIIKEKAQPIAIGGVHDHVHVLLRMKNSHSLSNIVNKLKCLSSKLINKQNKDCLW